MLAKDRKSSFGRKTSFGSPSKSTKRRANSSSSNTGSYGVVTDSKVPPALPDFALGAAAKIVRETDAGPAPSPTVTDSFSKMLSRTQTSQSMGDRLAAPSQSAGQQQQQNMWAGSEASVVYAQVQEIAHKRMQTMEYLRKA